jgi:NAD(P)-dependent dehydrogenase (short-subunit alcohol dehydrogenase family)
VILVDDSIVRGTTSVKIVEMVRDAGAAEVHMRISSPPTTHSCFYGIDTPERSEAARRAARRRGEMARIIGVDSLAFISIDGLYRAVGHGPAPRSERRNSATPASPATTRSPLAHVDPKIWKSTIDLNLTANWRLLRSADPLLRASPAGRAIFVTSGVTRRTVPYWGPYTVAKSALESMVRMYAAEMAHTSVKVNLVNPGPMRTGMRVEAFPGEDPQSVPPPEELAEAFVPLAAADCQLNGEWIAADEWLAARKLTRQ